MTYLSLRQWSNQFGNPRVVARIRRTILGRLTDGACVCVLDDGAAGLTDAARAEIERGWPPSKLRFSVSHPSALRLPANRERHPRRPRL